MPTQRQIDILVTPGDSQPTVAKTITVRISLGEEVMWRSHSGHAKIQFDKDGPFDEPVFEIPRGAAMASGVPLKEGTFKYSVFVTIRGDNRTYAIDPEVRVDP